MKRSARLLPTLFCALILLAPAAASSLTFSLDQRYEGSAGIPAGPTPWLDATIDAAGANRVRLTLAASGLSGGESVGSWFFNLDPGVALPFFSYVSGPAAEITLGRDALAAGSAGGFDIQFLFTESFTAGISAIYEFFLPAGEGPLSAASFDFETGGGFFSAARVLGPNAAFAWVAAARDSGPGPGPAPVPEPATMLLVGVGLGGMALFKKRRRPV